MAEKIIQINDSVWKDKPLNELKKYVKDFYLKNLKGKSVINKDKGITIIFPTSGIKHLLYARGAGYVKLIAVKVLDKMIRVAKFTNFKDRDEKDSKTIIGYMHFKVKVYINKKRYNFRIVVRIAKNGKFYYDHSVKV